MNRMTNCVITGTGSYIPPKRVRNEDFLSTDFYDVDGQKLERSNQEIIDKFHKITTIAERRYVSEDLVTSDIAYYAAKNALEERDMDKEELDYIIVAHNFGDVRSDNRRTDMVPSLGARVKEKLGIENPNTVAYDITFGCPGWLQALIQGSHFIRCGGAKKILVIGAEILSRVSDPHDRDSMLYGDGAGATLIEGKDDTTARGVLAHRARSDTSTYAKMLRMERSYHPEHGDPEEIFLKMNGRKLYQYALERVPIAIKECLEKSKVHLQDVKKVLVHQANGKMDKAILDRLYSLFNINKIPQDIMPMTIDWLGNSSVATLPTLLDLILKGKMDDQEIEEGDHLVFASVGAGMNINAVTYRV